jgi:hypothetical protein
LDVGGLPSNATARVEFRNPDGRLDQFTNLAPGGAARYCGSARLAIFPPA